MEAQKKAEKERKQREKEVHVHVHMSSMCDNNYMHVTSIVPTCMYG